MGIGGGSAADLTTEQITVTRRKEQRERQTDRQTDRDRQRDRETERETERWCRKVGKK